MDIEPRLPKILAPIFTGIVVLGIVDVYLDQPRSWWSFHILVELGLILLSLGAAVFLWLGWRHSARSVEELERALERQQAERDGWRQRAQEAIEGFEAAIDAQFDDWDLTPAERDIALLVIKGYSHKRAAQVSDRSERTVRQHAVSVYRKSGLSGRAELAGFFLEDLLVPTTQAPTADA